MSCHSFRSAPALLGLLALFMASACGGEPGPAPGAQNTAPDAADVETPATPEPGPDLTETIPPDIRAESTLTEDEPAGVDEDHDRRAGGEAHVHGEAELALVIELTQVEISFEAPLEGLLGFENEPANEDEEDAMSGLMLQLESSTAIVLPSAAAACVTMDSDVEIVRNGDHATLYADYTLNCNNTERIADIEVAALRNYPGLETVDVVIISGDSQAASAVSGPDAVFEFDL